MSQIPSNVQRKTGEPGQQLALIPHDYQGQLITQRSGDGYINATAMCRATGKEWSRYRALQSTKDFFSALALDLALN